QAANFSIGMIERPKTENNIPDYSPIWLATRTKLNARIGAFLRGRIPHNLTDDHSLMKTHYPILTLAIVAVAAASFSVKADDDEIAKLERRNSAALLAPIDSPDYIKYAPDRDVQVLHLALDVTPDFKARTVQ